jgi:hypothetical protein
VSQIGAGQSQALRCYGLIVLDIKSPAGNCGAFYFLFIFFVVFAGTICPCFLTGRYKTRYNTSNIQVRGLVRRKNIRHFFGGQ